MAYAGTIIQSDTETGTNTDILAGTRLQNAPANGVMLFEMQASDAVAANKYVVSIQLPNGGNPMDGVLVPAGETAGLAGVLDERTKLMYSAQVEQGGHVVFSVVETGDTEFTHRVTFQPY